MQNVMQALYLTRNARGLPASVRRYSSGTVDINDAQYIYELYHANLYADTAGAGNVLQLLTCDMNRDGQIAVDDARVVAYKLISR